MPRLVCKACQVAYKVKKNDVRVVVMFNNPPEPYQIWSANLWACPGCGNEVVSGFGAKPLAEHYQLNFKEYLKGGYLTEPVIYEYEKAPAERMAARF